jgi:hypothetical protein
MAHMLLTNMSGLYYKSFMILIYDRNDSSIIIYDRNDSSIIIYDRNYSGQCYKPLILANLP